MLTNFQIKSSKLHASISLGDEQRLEQRAWISVLIGQNGSRKSYVLRQLMESSLGKRSYTDLKRRKVVTETTGWPQDKPSGGTICISGTPLDRFSRVGSPLLGAHTPRQFWYLGQRASNGMAGTGQSERALITALLENADLLPERQHLLEGVFSHLGLKPQIIIQLKLSKEFAKAVKSYHTATYFASDILEEVAKKLKTQYLGTTRLTHLHTRLHAAFEKLDSNEHFSVFKLANRFDTSKSPASLKFEHGTFQMENGPSQEWGTAELELLLHAGFLEIDKTFFTRSSKTDDPRTLSEECLEGEDLSSGQWSWLCGFAGLCATVKPHSLVLVDEPENSLHPAWQLQYIPMLNSILREFQGTQAVIATHSPLIASGVAPEWGNVQTLEYTEADKNGTHRLSTRPIASTFGWTASDVYQEVFQLDSARAPAFTKTAEYALSLIRSNQSLDDNACKIIANDLFKDVDTLPVHDPLRNVLLDITDELKLRAGDERQ
ncbi:putative ATPase [Pseudomonas sp. TE6288]|uniref:AAA family ATPase n=1 Tax=Pseudomonas hunanensis TaxID=1247546 RepID=UPI002406C355|nr:AAA family ATPase [Pseudomonas hunanensis]MDF9755829.1 putative ATPase [Pseudomonas hunanensis]